LEILTNHAWRAITKRGLIERIHESLGVQSKFEWQILLFQLKVAREKPRILYCDNKSTMSIVHNPVQHVRIKHVEMDRHFINEKLDSGLITTSYISYRLSLVDLFTKGLPTERFHYLTCRSGMIDIHSPP